jgi:hypothetical protein
MAEYKVTTFFTDLQDRGYAYNVGDTFPREGKTVTPQRIMELASTGNKRGVSLIEEVKPKVVKEKPAPSKKESKRKASQKEK